METFATVIITSHQWTVICSKISWLLEVVAQSSEHTTALWNQPQPTLPALQPTPSDSMAFCKVKSQPAAM